VKYIPLQLKKNKMKKENLLYKLTGTETPKFINERENVIIDKCLNLINNLESEVENLTIPVVKPRFSDAEITDKAIEYAKEFEIRDKPIETAKIQGYAVRDYYAGYKAALNEA
jgi:hypothetical protein